MRRIVSRGSWPEPGGDRAKENLLHRFLHLLAMRARDPAAHRTIKTLALPPLRVVPGEVAHHFEAGSKRFTTPIRGYHEPFSVVFPAP